MGFELPLALLGLLGVAAPVAAHLMRRRDLPVIALPTVALLDRAQAKSRKRMHLVDLLLLAARILLVAALAIAVADPYVTVQLAYGDGRVASVAIVIDDSMSMERTEEDDGRGETLSTAARELAADAISSLPRGSEVSVVLAGAPVRLLVPRTGDLGDALAAVEALEDDPPSARGTDLPGGVARALRELAAARIDTRRLLVITDGAAHAHQGEVRWPDDGVGVDVQRIVGAEANRAIVSARASPDPTTPGQASVAVEIRSFGGGAEAVVTLARDGEEVSRATADLSSGIGRVTLHTPSEDGGAATALLALEGRDAVSVDDERAVLLRPNAALRVLVVDGDPHQNRERDEVGYLARALDLAPAEAGSIAYRVVDRDTAEATDLAGWDVVVLANVRVPSTHATERLVEFVADGGGLFVAAGDRIDPAGYQARLGAILPARPRAIGAAPAPIGLVPAEDASALVPTDGLENVRATERVILEAPPESTTLLRFDDGAPALVLGAHGEGRVALLALPVDTAWSDLPYRPGFLPLMVELLAALGPRDRLPERAVPAGTMVRVPTPSGADRVVVVDPGGGRHEGPADEPFELTETDRPGAYVVLPVTDGVSRDGDGASAFVVAPPAEESDLRADEEADTGDEEGRGEVESRGTTVRSSIAPWLFLLAGILAIVEAGLRSRRPLRAS